MSKVHTNHLALSWSISKGRDTYGYNICRLDSSDSGKRYRCMGGGYDMIGTVVADWLVAEHQDKLRTLVLSGQTFYGMYDRQSGGIGIDGACGINTVERIAQACGIELQRLSNRRGNTVGFIASWEV